MVKAMGLITSGSAAKTLTSHPGGTFRRLTDSCGERYGWPEGLVLSNPNSRWPWTRERGRDTTAAMTNKKRRGMRFSELPSLKFGVDINRSRRALPVNQEEAICNRNGQLFVANWLQMTHPSVQRIGRGESNTGGSAKGRFRQPLGGTSG